MTSVIGNERNIPGSAKFSPEFQIDLWINLQRLRELRDCQLNVSTF
jgi:hypothetical protein